MAWCTGARSSADIRAFRSKNTRPKTAAASISLRNIAPRAARFPACSRLQSSTIGAARKRSSPSPRRRPRPNRLCSSPARARLREHRTHLLNETGILTHWASEASSAFEISDSRKRKRAAHFEPPSTRPGLEDFLQAARAHERAPNEDASD